MIRPRCLTAFTRDAAHALGILTVVAAVADYATEAKHLRTLAAELTDANTRLRYERDVYLKHANRLVSANQDLVAVVQMQTEHIAALTTLDADDDAEEYEPAAPIPFGPAVIAEQVAEFRAEIEAWGGEVK